MFFLSLKLLSLYLLFFGLFSVLVLLFCLLAYCLIRPKGKEQDRLTSSILIFFRPVRFVQVSSLMKVLRFAPIEAKECTEQLARLLY